MFRAKCLFALTLLAACGSKKPQTAPPILTGEMASQGSGSAVAPNGVISTDILAREPVANNAVIKHILISWKELGDESGRPVTEAAEKRSKADAEEVVRTILGRIKGGESFDNLMKEYSDDPGSAANAKAFDVAPDAGLVIEFRQLGLRLNIDEVGVVQSDFGLHIMKRIK